MEIAEGFYCEHLNSAKECLLYNAFEPEERWKKCCDLQPCPIGLERGKPSEPIPSEEQKMINRIKQCANERKIKLSEWEIGFVKSVDKHSYFTFRQREIIEKLFKRCPNG